MSDFLLSSSLLLTLIVGGSGLVLFYILRLFRNEERDQSEQVSSSSLPKKESTGVKSKKKQPSGDRWSRAGDKKNFSSPWLLKTLKNHTGQVMNIDYSSSGKYLASCGEEDPDPDPDLDINTSSGSECNKENSRPPSAEPSPRITKGLSRRQRKNRRRDDSSPDSKKKVKDMDRSKIGGQQQQPQHTPKGLIPDRTFAGLLDSHLLTHEQLFSMGYPVQSPDYNNAVVFLHMPTNMFTRPTLAFDVNAREFVPSSNSSDSEESSGSEPDLTMSYYNSPKEQDLAVQRACVRCDRGFFVTKREYLTQERCIYHWGKIRAIHRNGPVLYTCCQAKPGSVGCTTCKLHVWNGTVSGVNGPCEGYVKMRDKARSNSIYAIDCEMCYTVAGLEVTKVSVVATDGKRVYDTYIKPKNEIVDYNTRFSGVTANDLKSESAKTLKEVQYDLRRFISANTILIGHGLENDLRALKIVHKKIVDTAWSFPHYNGLPYRRSLKCLVSTYLQRQIQCGTSGHNSYEDAVACIELMLHKVRHENRDYLL